MEKYVLSKAHQDGLYWLGRYTERVYTTLDLFAQVFDEMIDGDPKAYQKLLKNLEIADIYTDKRVLISATVLTRAIRIPSGSIWSADLTMP